MKRLLPLVLLLASTACGTYHQVATLSSPDIKLSSDGLFSYTEKDVTISYDFWASYGQVSFVVSNDSDNDIYIDLSRSFFLVNGMTYDYFQNRSFSSGHLSTVTNIDYRGRSSTYAQASRYSNNLATGTSYTNATSSTITSTRSSSSGLVVTEKEGVWVPAHASRGFSEFSLLDAPYRQCGFARNPKQKEKIALEFDDVTSPYQYENRLMIVVGGKDRPITNTFFISEITNLPESSAMEVRPALNCAGKDTGYTRSYYKNRAPNKFYIIYTLGSDERGDNDRLK